MGWKVQNGVLLFSQEIARTLRHRTSKEYALLVACYSTLHPALLVRRSIRRSIRRSVRHILLFLGFCALWPPALSIRPLVGRSHFTFFRIFFYLTAPAQMVW